MGFAITANQAEWDDFLDQVEEEPVPVVEGFELVGDAGLYAGLPPPVAGAPAAPAAPAPVPAAPIAMALPAAPVTTKPENMEERLFEALKRLSPIVSQAMVDALHTAQVYSEDVFHDIVDDSKNARLILARVAGIKFTDGQPDAAGAVPLAKLFNMWNGYHAKYDTDAAADSVTAKMLGMFIDAQKTLLHYERPNYYNVCEKSLSKITNDLEKHKFTVFDLDFVKCAIKDSRVPDANMDGVDGTDGQIMIWQGFENGAPVLVPRKEHQTYQKWKRQTKLYYPALQTVGNLQFPVKNKEGKVVPWFSETFLQEILARMDQFCFDAQAHNRLNYENGYQSERDFRSAIFDELRADPNNKSFDSVFKEIGRTQLRELFKYQSNQSIPRAIGAAGSDDGAGPRRRRGGGGGGGGRGGGDGGSKKAKGKGSQGGGKGKNARATPYQTTGNNKDCVKCSNGKPFYQSYKGVNFCVAYNRGECKKPNCQDWHFCSYIDCDKPWQKNLCKVVKHTY